MGKLKQELRRIRQQELLTLFNHQTGDYYEEKEWAGRVYVKQYNAGTGKWQVAEYSQSSFARYKAFNVNAKLNNEMRKAIDNDQ